MADNETPKEEAQVMPEATANAIIRLVKALGAWHANKRKDNIQFISTVNRITKVNPEEVAQAGMLLRWPKNLAIVPSILRIAPFLANAYMIGRERERETMNALSLILPDNLTEAALVDKPDPTVIDLVLHCPSCKEQHIDMADESRGWTNPPHRTHECLFCGFTWRPCDRPTNGVFITQTHGKNDNQWRLPNGVYTRHPQGKKE